MRKVNLTGINVLIEKIENQEKSSGGIILPEDNKSGQTLDFGKVIDKGPGFLTPHASTVDSEVDRLIKGEESIPQYIPLDIENGDKVYYEKSHAEDIFLEGKRYIIIPYVAIKLYIRG
jgi:co-chaperonin GroES (HSP10)